MARRKAATDLPSFDKLMIPTIKALQELGGSGSVEEINSNVYEIAKISVKDQIFRRRIQSIQK